MVLYKRKPVVPLPLPPLPADPDTYVWHIPATGEWFLDYDAYLARMDHYLQHKFVCDITGNLQLTYFEAAALETKEISEVEQHFPEALREPVLRYVQFSTTPRVDTLVDEVYGRFKNDFYPGEHVLVKLAGQRHQGIVREKAHFNAVTLADGTVRPLYCQYRISRSADSAEITANDTHLLRDRRHFTKWYVKNFIKLTCLRLLRIGAPWVVKPEYAKKYRIPTKFPEGLAQFDVETEKKVEKKSETPVVVPVKKVVHEDLEQPLLGTRPVPASDLDSPGLLLETWTFLNMYRVPLVLDLFTFDDWVAAIGWTWDDVTAYGHCNLLNEVFCAVLKHTVHSGHVVGVWGDSVLDEDENEAESADSPLSDVSDPSGEQHQAYELLNYRGVRWQQRVSRGAFRDGGWQVVLLGVLSNLEHTPHAPEIDQVFRALAPLDATPLPLAAMRNFHSNLSVPLRLLCLSLLCDLLVNGNVIRSYIDRSMEDATRIRRERLEAIRDYKMHLDDSRVAEAQLEALEGKENVDEDRAKYSDQKTRSLELVEEKRRLKRDFERQLIETDCQRIQYLGRDRMHNLYWWFEQNGLPAFSGFREEDEDDEDDSVVEVPLETYLMGRLWVQGPAAEEMQSVFGVGKNELAKWEQSQGEYAARVQEVFGVDVAKSPSTPLEQKLVLEAPRPLLLMDDWVYYLEPGSVDALIAWCNPLGTREVLLRRELGHVRDAVAASMEARRGALGLEEREKEEAELKKEIVELDESEGASESEAESVDSELSEEVPRTRRNRAAAEASDRRRERARSERVKNQENKRRKLEETRERRSKVESLKSEMERLQDAAKVRAAEWTNQRAIEDGGVHYGNGKKGKKGK